MQSIRKTAFGIALLSLLTLGLSFHSYAIERSTGQLTNNYRKEIRSDGTSTIQQQADAWMITGKKSGEQYTHRVFYQWSIPNSLIPDGSTITKARLEFNYRPYSAPPGGVNPTITKPVGTLTDGTGITTLFHSVENVPGFYDFPVANNYFNETIVPDGPGKDLLTWIHDGLAGDNVCICIWLSTTEGSNDYAYNVSDAKLTIWYQPATRQVNVDQLWSTNTSTSNLNLKVGVYNGTAFEDKAVPAGIPLDLNYSNSLRADTNIYTNPSTQGKEKYNNWDGLADVVNHHDLYVTPTTALTNAHFKQAYDATFQAQLLDAAGTPDTITLKDPWLRDDDSDGKGTRNRGLSAVWRTLGTTNQASTGDAWYKGIFVDENPDFRPDRPTYAVSALAGKMLGGYQAYFAEWSGTNATFQAPSATQSNVAFTQPSSGNSIVVSALYKAHLAANNSQGFATNGQRKLVRDGVGVLHMTYASAGSVWYSRSTDNGATWTPEVRVNMEGTQAKCPAISCSNDGGMYVFIAYQVDLGIEAGSFGPAIIMAEYSAGQFLGAALVGELPAYDFDATPAIMVYSTLGYVVYKYSVSDGLVGKQYLFSSGSVTSETPFTVPGTDANSLNPAVATYPVTNAPWYIVYQQGTTDIYAQLIDALPIGALRENISSGSGCSLNRYPSLAVYYNNVPYGPRYIPVVAWMGNNPYTTVCVTRAKINNAWSSFTQSGGYLAGGPEVSATTSSANQAIVGWWNSYSNYDAYRRLVSGAWQSQQSFSTPVGHFHISNGNDFTQMKAATFAATGSLPYRIAPVARDFSTLSKTDGNDGMLRGRQMVIAYQGGELLYGLRSLHVDGVSVPFVQVDDSLTTAHLQGLGRSLKSLPFTLSNQSVFTFTSTFRLLQADQLKDLKALGLKTELVDVKSGNVVGLFASRTSDQVKAADTSDIVFSVNCTQIQPGNYMLRMTAEGTDQDGATYAVVDQEFDDLPTTLGKQAEASVSFRGEIPMPTSFALENYPNPFNPATTIRLALPEDSEVRLTVFDVLGREVATLAHGFHKAGYHSYTWNAGTAASGLYFARLEVVDGLGQKAFTKTIKLLLTK